jgi:hypothetical protein
VQAAMSQAWEMGTEVDEKKEEACVGCSFEKRVSKFVTFVNVAGVHQMATHVLKYTKP